MKAHQHGLILPALLVLLLIGGMAAMLGQSSSLASVEAHRLRITQQSLAKARLALLTYAQTYHITHNSTVGFLPCPDKSPEGDGDEGSADSPCGAAGHFAIGRFPYRTLGMPPLRDGYGECLWYAVSGRFKNQPIAGTLTWDTPGQFSITSPSGEVLNPAMEPRQYAVAAIFSAGPPLPGQHRGAPNRQCNGNADASLAIHAFLDHNYPASGTIPSQLAGGTPGDQMNNDTIVWLSATDVFSEQFIRTTTFKVFVDTMLSELASALATHPLPSPEPSMSIAYGNVEVGGLPAGSNTAGAPAESQTLHRYQTWADQFRYIRCTDGSECLTTTIDSPCRAIVLFSGSASETQQRALGGDGEYFEAPNPDALSNPSIPFDGQAAFTAGPSNSSQDLVQCIHASVP